MPTEPSDQTSGPAGLSDADRAELKRRSDALGAQLEKYRDDPVVVREREQRGKTNSAYGQALKMALEPLVGVLVGLGVGVYVDNTWGTKPLFLILGLLIGGAAGMLNLIRSAQRTGSNLNTRDKSDDPVAKVDGRD